MFIRSIPATTWTCVLAIALYVTLVAGAVGTRSPFCDEGWLANPALSFLTNGTLGTTIVEEATPSGQIANHRPTRINTWTYWVMPLHFVAQIGWFKLVGFGLTQLRVLSLLFGAAMLVAIALVARQLATPRAAAIAMSLLCADYMLVWSGGLGRMETMAAAFTFGGLALFLLLSGRRFSWAVAASNTCWAIALLTHPVSALTIFSFVVVLLAVYWRQIRVRHLAIAAMPYIVGALAWAAYISIDPVAFQDQFTGNSQHRLQYVFDPIAGLWSEKARWGRAYQWGPYVPPLAGVVLIPVLYMVALAVGWLWSRSRASTPLWAMATVQLAAMVMLDGDKNQAYLVYILPLLGLVAAASVDRAIEQIPHSRWPLYFVIAAFALWQATAVVMRETDNPNSTQFAPAVAAAREHLPPNGFIFASGEFGFPFGFTTVRDDVRLGYYSGLDADVIILNENYRAFLSTTNDDAQFAAYLTTLRKKYVTAYVNRDYTVWRRVAGESRQAGDVE